MHCDGFDKRQFSKFVIRIEGSISSIDREAFEFLLKNESLLSTVFKQYGPEIEQDSKYVLDVNPLSNVGQNRSVYGINIIDNFGDQIGAVAVKISRYKDAAADDHVAMTYAVDRYLEREGPILASTPDDRYVWFGAYHDGIPGDIFIGKNSQKAIELIASASVEQWHNLGERFIYEPKASQFMISDDLKSARLIDKGHFRKLDDVDVSYDFKFVDGVMVYDAYISTPSSEGMQPFDICNLDQWLQTMSAFDLVIRVANYLYNDLFDRFSEFLSYVDVDGGAEQIIPEFTFPIETYLDGVELGIKKIGLDVKEFFMRVIGERVDQSSDFESKIMSSIKSRAS